MKLDIGAPSNGAPRSLGERIDHVRAQIAEFAVAAGRDPASIRLVGVTKKQPREAVAAAVQAGLSDIAENYVQEAAPKFAGLAAAKHFIGHVQTNKAKAIVETFDVVQSVDRLEAGLALHKASQSLGKPIVALVQVNISATERFGVAPRDAPALVQELRARGLVVDGIMAIGPNTSDTDETARAFTEAARVFERVGGTTLSIGMSGDFAQAIACGSTMVRIGTALFGARA
ncbi:MAG TPA: YggS family pyridoxal phosphate-dependent enzyme [Candidatus Acidoferrales bacterium]|nr:YggS family pyridoxal phosphate-dependent enzyme [Candidatus Acidoferrales bacterium]